MFHVPTGFRGSLLRDKPGEVTELLQACRADLGSVRVPTKPHNVMEGRTLVFDELNREEGGTHGSVSPCECFGTETDREARHTSWPQRGDLTMATRETHAEVVKLYEEGSPLRSLRLPWVGSYVKPLPAWRAAHTAGIITACQVEGGDAAVPTVVMDLLPVYHVRTGDTTTGTDINAPDSTNTLRRCADKLLPMTIGSKDYLIVWVESTTQNKTAVIQWMKLQKCDAIVLTHEGCAFFKLCARAGLQGASELWIVSVPEQVSPPLRAHTLFVVFCHSAVYGAAHGETHGLLAQHHLMQFRRALAGKQPREPQASSPIWWPTYSAGARALEQLMGVPFLTEHEASALTQRVARDAYARNLTAHPLYEMGKRYFEGDAKKKGDAKQAEARAAFAAGDTANPLFPKGVNYVEGDAKKSDTNAARRAEEDPITLQQFAAVAAADASLSPQQRWERRLSQAEGKAGATSRKWTKEHDLQLVAAIRQNAGPTGVMPSGGWGKVAAAVLGGGFTATEVAGRWRITLST